MAVLTAAEALRWAMEIEKNGEAFYNAVAARSTDPQVKALFEDLAVQERGEARP
jgi:rubrerythrin